MVTFAPLLLWGKWVNWGGSSHTTEWYPCMLDQGHWELLSFSHRSEPWREAFPTESPHQQHKQTHTVCHLQRQAAAWLWDTLHWKLLNLKSSLFPLQMWLQIPEYLMAGYPQLLTSKSQGEGRIWGHSWEVMDAPFHRGTMDSHIYQLTINFQLTVFLIIPSRV